MLALHILKKYGSTTKTDRVMKFVCRIAKMCLSDSLNLHLELGARSRWEPVSVPLNIYALPIRRCIFQLLIVSLRVCNVPCQNFGMRSRGASQQAVGMISVIPKCTSTPLSICSAQGEEYISSC
jgi:hypothetical protein